MGCGSVWLWVVGYGLAWLGRGRGLASWVRISGLGSVDGGFETVDLLIGGWIDWVDH